jgi:hypothetical protein
MKLQIVHIPQGRRAYSSSWFCPCVLPVEQIDSFSMRIEALLLCV